jgi:hypothetical protein
MKGTIMVAAAVPRFGFQPTLCLARPMLLEALDCYERGDYIGAGVRLRESVTRFLVAAVEWYAVPLSKNLQRDKHPRPAALARALHDAKFMDSFALDIVLESLAAGNTLAHCGRACPKGLRGCISMLFFLVDSEPYSALKERQPAVAATFDENADDDDGADWWKAEGGAA